MSELFSYLRDAFSRPDDRTIARRELDDARRQLLLHRSSAEYNQKLAEFYASKIDRLEAYLT